MVRPETAKRPGSNPAQHTSDTSGPALRLQQSIDSALQSIRQQRRLLRRVRDSGYDVTLARQQVLCLSDLQGDIQQLLEQADELDPLSLEAVLQKSSGARSRLDQLEAAWNRSNAEPFTKVEQPTKKELKKQLQEAILMLQATLSEFEAELEDVSEGNPAAAEQQKQLAQLQRAVEREQQQIAISDLGKSRKAMLLKQLHHLMQQVYRLRQLASKPRLQQQLNQLEGTALQIQDTVNELDLEASNASELLETSLYALEKRLIQFECDRRLGFVTFPASWFINRYRDVALMKSVQGRVLSGLGFSLALSGLTFFVCTIPLTLVSGYASRSQDGIRKTLAEQQRVFTVEVNEFLQLEQEREALQTQIANLNSQIALESAQTAAAQEAEAAGDDVSSASDEAIEEAEAPGVSDVDVSQPSGLLKTQAEVLAKQSSNEEKRQKKKTEVVTNLREIQALYAALSGDLAPLKDVAGGSEVASESLLQRVQSNQGGNGSGQENQTLTSLANFITDKGLLDHSRRILLAAFAGALGSMMSILIRLDQMEKEDIKNPFLLGALKPLIGAIFGIAVFAILSTRVIDILPSSFYLYERQLGEARADTGAGTLPAELRGDPLGELDSQELYKIFLVAFLAGFSERLANDTLKSVGSTRSLG